MYWFRRLLLLLPGRRRARARELEEELRANLALAMEDAGSEREARRDFGSFTRAHEESRAVWFPGWDAISQDLRFAARTLRRAPVFTIVAVLSLAFGTGAATALFSLVDAVVLKPLAYREPGRLVFVREVVPPLAHIYPTLPVNYQHYRFWRQQAGSFDGLAAITGSTVTLRSGGEPEQVGAAEVTANLFDLLGVPLQRGRSFEPGEEERDRPRPAIITDGLWRRRFGGLDSILGQTVQIGAGQCTIVGVLAPSFRFPRKADLGPLSRLPERPELFLPIREFLTGWGGDYDYLVIGRLRPGVPLARGAAELNLLESRIAKDHDLSTDLHVHARPLQEVISSPVRTSLTVLLAAVLVLVLIVCVNLANLLLARGSARAREYSLRVALGAARGRLLISALVETLLLSCAGGVLGILAAYAALGLFVSAAPVDLPRLDEVQIDGRVLAFALGLTLACGLLFGLLPALRLSRTDPQSVLRGESRTASGSRHGLRLREWLVGGEVALSTLLLVLAGLLVSSLWHVLTIDRGFTGGAALDVALNLGGRYQRTKERAAFLDLAAERLRALPGVRAVGVINRVPLTGESNVNSVRTDSSADGALDPRTRQLVMTNVRFVNEDYFSAIGLPLVRGRLLESADRDRSVAVVSERLAAKLWPGQDPIGRVILSAGSGVKQSAVVGVVADVHGAQLERDPTLMIYVPFWSQAFQVSDLVVRAAPGGRVAPEEVRRAIRAIDPGIPAPRMRTMDEIVAESVAQRRFQMRVAAGFAVSALLLAALGIYGVVAYGVALRRRELGIRMALGARAGQVRRLVVWQGLRPVIIGLVCGLTAALAAGSLVRTLLFGVQATDGLTLASVAAGLALVATIACLLPAHSAARIHPSAVLRDE
jgi:putative ABC transport system permease protein